MLLLFKGIPTRIKADFSFSLPSKCSLAFSNTTKCHSLHIDKQSSIASSSKLSIGIDNYLTPISPLSNTTKCHSLYINKQSSLSDQIVANSSKLDNDNNNNGLMHIPIEPIHSTILKVTVISLFFRSFFYSLAVINLIFAFIIYKI
jgi:hypothetical protein